MTETQERHRSFLAQLSQTSRAMRTLFDAELRTLDLTLARGRLLLHLVSTDTAVGQGDLSDLLEVEHPTTVRLLDGLEQLGHIERRPMPGDRRAKEIVLTDKGRQLGERVLAITDRLRDEMLQGFSDEEIVLASRVLERLSQRLQRTDHSGEAAAPLPKLRIAR